MHTDRIVELNVGGHHYTTSADTLTRKSPDSRLARLVAAADDTTTAPPPSDDDDDAIPLRRDAQNRVFVDRDGATFRWVLEYMRRRVDGADDAAGARWLARCVPAACERARLKSEAEFYGLVELAAEIARAEAPGKPLAGKAAGKFVRTSSGTNLLNDVKTTATSLPVSNTGKSGSKASGGGRRATRDKHSTALRSGQLAALAVAEDGPYFLTIGYRASYESSRDMPSNDVTRFRRVNRITVSGRSDVAKQVFLEDLNDSRDPDRYPSNGYTCRYYLKHNYLELAFETLAQHGFRLISTCAVTTAHATSSANTQTQCEAIFFREPDTAGTGGGEGQR